MRVQFGKGAAMKGMRIRFSLNVYDSQCVSLVGIAKAVHLDCFRLSMITGVYLGFGAIRVFLGLSDSCYSGEPEFAVQTSLAEALANCRLV